MVQPGASGGLACAVAAALAETAHELADAVENAELLLVHLPPTPGITDTLRKLRDRAELLGIAHACFKEMAEHPETPVVFERTVYAALWHQPVTKP